MGDGAGFAHPNAGGDFGRTSTSELERIAQGLLESLQAAGSASTQLNAVAGRIGQLAAAVAATAAKEPGAEIGPLIGQLDQGRRQCQSAVRSLGEAQVQGKAWASQAVSRAGG